MPIRRRQSLTKKDTVYIEYYFWKDGICQTRYCGIEGTATARKNLEAAVEEHRRYRKTRYTEADTKIQKTLDDG